jgi:hypothetical protein
MGTTNRKVDGIEKTHISSRPITWAKRHICTDTATIAFSLSKLVDALSVVDMNCQSRVKTFANRSHAARPVNDKTNNWQKATQCLVARGRRKANGLKERDRRIER